MPRIRGEGFNKEKFVCLISLLLVGFMAVLLALARFHPVAGVVWLYSTVFGSAPPDALGEQAPVTTSVSPSAYQEQALPPLPSLAALGDKIRKTPFAPTQYKIERVITPNVTRRPTQVTVAPPPPALPQPKPPAPAAPNRPVAPKDKELEVAYMGVMEVQDQTYGLLRAKDGSFRRVKVGDTMEDFNYTITRIEKQAIYVKTEEGRVYMLKNNRFTDVAGAGTGGGQPKDNVPSFAEPKKNPGTQRQAPGPQRKPPGTQQQAPGTQQQGPAQRRPEGRPQGRPQPRQRG